MVNKNGVMFQKNMNKIKSIDKIKKEIALECAEEHFDVLFEEEINIGDYNTARSLWNEIGDRYIKQFDFY